MERVRRLTDEERIAIAAARELVDEAFHEKAVRAGVEAMAGRGEDYLRARAALAAAHLADAEGAARDWATVARLVQLAIDDGLIAVVATPALHPNHLRELHRSLQPVLSSG